MKRVLVTGINGFIGNQCIPLLLEKGYEVVGCGRSKSGDKRIQWESVNLLNLDAVEKLVKNVKPTHLLNLAWYTAPGKFFKSPENLLWVEAGTTLLRAFAESGGIRFVGAGSCAEYDWNYGHLSEFITPCKSQTPFGRFKNSLFELSSTYAELSKISFAWGRIFFVYGPHEKETRLVASIIKSLLTGKEALCSAGKQIRDFSHAHDVAAAFVKLLESDIQGPVNVASGEPVSIKSIAEQIGNLTGRPDLIKLGAIPMAENDPPVLTANVQRLQVEAGFLPCYDLASGLKDTILSFKGE